MTTEAGIATLVGVIQTDDSNGAKLVGIVQGPALMVGVLESDE